MDLCAFFAAEFAEHAEVVRRTEAALANEFAALVQACTRSLRAGGKLMLLRQWRQRGRRAASRDRTDDPLQGRPSGHRGARADHRYVGADRAGNDLGFEQVFARQIAALGRPGDVAIGISTSGKSPNVLAALRQARAMQVVTIGLSGKDGGDREVCRSSADRAVGHDRAHPGDAHPARADAVRRGRNRARPRALIAARNLHQPAVCHFAGCCDFLALKIVFAALKAFDLPERRVSLCAQGENEQWKQQFCPGPVTRPASARVRAAGERHNIQSVDRALFLLESIAEAGGETTLTDLSQRTGLNISTCHHLACDARAARLCRESHRQTALCARPAHSPPRSCMPAGRPAAPRAALSSRR